MKNEMKNSVQTVSASFWTKNVLTFDEAVEYSGYSRSYLYKLTSAKKIPFYKPQGKLVFFLRSELESWLLQNRSKPECEIEQDAIAYMSAGRRPNSKK